MFKPIVVSVTAAAALLAAGCGSKQEEKITIGVINNAVNYSLGEEQLQSVALAVKQINAAGGVLGKQLESVQKEDFYDNASAKSAADALVNQLHVPAIIGSNASSTTLAISDVTIPNHVVQISPQGVSPSISDLVDDGYVNRTCASNLLQAKLLAERARAKGFTRVAAIQVNGNTFSSGLVAAFQAAFNQPGETVTIVETVTAAQASYVTQLNDIFATAPQAILAPAYAGEIDQMVRDYADQFASSKPAFWFFTSGTADADFVTGVGADRFTSIQHEGTVGYPATDDAAYKAYAAAFAAEYGVQPTDISYGSNTYDAVYLIALAMEAGQSATGESIKNNLRAVSEGGTAYNATNYKEAAAAARAGTDINYEGASGNVDLDEKGDVAAPYGIWKVVGGSISIVEKGIVP